MKKVIFDVTSPDFFESCCLAAMIPPQPARTKRSVTYVLLFFTAGTRILDFGTDNGYGNQYDVKLSNDVGEYFQGNYHHCHHHPKIRNYLKRPGISVLLFLRSVKYFFVTYSLKSTETISTWVTNILNLTEKPQKIQPATY